MPTPIDLDDYRADLERIRDARQAWHAAVAALDEPQRAQLSPQQLADALQAAQRAQQVYTDHCTVLTMTLMIEAKLPE